MSFVRKFTNSLKAMKKSEQGAVALITGIAAIPLFLSAGVAVDFIRHLNVETNVQQSLDAGALAGAAALGASDSVRVGVAEKAFNANLNRNQIGQTDVKFRIEKGYLKASVNAEVNTTFMKLAGIDHTTVTAEAEVNLLSSKKAEIALVLDYSGSMDTSVRGEKKYISMQKAASKLVDDLTKLEKGKFKIGLVPFSHHVYVTLPKRYVAGQSGTGSWTGCTVDRLGPFNTTNASPNANDDSTKWGQKQADKWPGNQNIINDQLRNDCDGPGKNDGYAARKLIVKPLTTDLSSVKSQLSAMRPYAYTHIALGAEFGYQLLTPNGTFGTDVAKFKDKDLEKYMVILTDGSQTAPAYNKTTNLLGETSVEQGEKNLVSLCKAAKADGIRVITIAFDLTDKDASKAQETKDRLKSCASEEGYYFDAKDGTDISAAFKSITQEIAQNIFLSK